MDCRSMRAELEKNHIYCPVGLCEAEIEKKFYALPITAAQKERLAVFGIVYKDSWGWSRRAAQEFLEDAFDYNERLKRLPVSPAQKAILMEYGIFDFSGMDSGQAAEKICSLPASEEQAAYVRKFRLADAEGLSYGSAMAVIRRHKERILGMDWDSVLGAGR